MEMNLGSKGATFQSWHADAIRVIFRELQSDHPRANEKQLVKHLAERLADDPNAAKAAAEYIVKNMMGVQRGYNSSREPQNNRQAVAAAVQAGVNRILLLNYPMPNGQRLRFCSGTYVKKLGGAFERVGKKAGAKLIGEVFDEQSLRQCMGVDVEA
jgi:hypothetical protein